MSSNGRPASGATEAAHKRAEVLMKTGRSPHALRYVWYNAFDPLFLRYAVDPDFRGVKVIPLSPAVATLSWKANREHGRGGEEVRRAPPARARARASD